MKKNKIILLICFIFFIALHLNVLAHESEIYQGDFSFRNSSTSNNITVKMECVSIPFEGTNLDQPGTINRVGILQNGYKYRKFEPNNSFTQKNIFNYVLSVTPGQQTDLGICGGNQYEKPFGWGKYKITINDGTHDYVYYFNNLDSKYGYNYPGGIYGRDFVSDYIYENGQYVIKFSGSGSTIGLVYAQPSTPPEFKVWEIIFNQSNPVETFFYARTTPFGISPELFFNTDLGELVLGTKVVIDEIYNYTGSLDNKGYNTVTNYFGANYYSNPNIGAANIPGKTITTPGSFNSATVQSGIKFIIESGNWLTFDENIDFWVNALGEDIHDEVIMKSGSTFQMHAGTKLNMYNGGKFIYEGGTINFYGGCNINVYDKSEFKCTSSLNPNSSGVGPYIRIMNGGKLTLGDNVVLIIKSGMALKLDAGAKVQLGTNSKIVIEDGGFIQADNIVFNSENSNVWQGIELTNADYRSYIKNCTFNKAVLPIKIANTNSSNVNLARTISGNIFNPSTNSTNCIYAEKCYNLFIDNNIFNASASTQIPLYIKNSPLTTDDTQGLGAGEPEVSDISESNNLNITNNTFNGGKAGMVTANYDATYSYYIFNNTFNNVDYGIVTRNNLGDIKNNKFLNNSNTNSLIIAQSNLNLANNDLKSNGVTMVATVNSNVNGSPSLADANTLLWTSGNNKFYSSGNDNVLLSGSDFFTDYSANCFDKASSYYHISGQTNNSNLIYNCRGNSWQNPSTPSVSLINNNSQPVTSINYLPTTACPREVSITGYETYDMGFGVFDTVISSTNLAGSGLNPDEEKYVEAYTFVNNNMFMDAINSYNQLITDYPESQYLNSALYEIYGAYQNLDTSKGDPIYKDQLYSTLKNFLDSRISSGLYSEEFNDAAYYLSVCCDAAIYKYQNAMDGFTFVALYNPDPEVRLAASWDATEVEALMNNHGGGQNETEELSFAKKLKRIDKISNIDPIQRKIKDSYKNRMQDQFADLEKISKTDSRYNEKVKSLSFNQLDDKIFSSKQKEKISRSKKILMTSKSFTKEQRNEEQLKDLIPSYGKDFVNKNGNNELVSSYALSQNYPNPFNPTTNIKYSLPKAGFVTIKVFDVVGRIVKELVSEFKETGNYSVVFDGSGIASGIYFYKLETTNFIDTKRMVLIK